MNDILKINTFSGLTIQSAGMPVIGFVSRKVDALLVYLACNPQEHPREVLAEMLWDDISQERSMSNLRTVIFSLQSQLAPYILINRQTIGINPDANIKVDVRAFEDGLNTVQQQVALRGSFSRTIATTMEQALAVYKGDFLAGFNIRNSRGFEGWQTLERERLRGRIIEAQYQLANYYFEARQFSAGIAQTARLLQLDPLWEKAHRLLMMLLTRSGQRSAALVQYETCRALLEEELGVEPDTETRALFERIHAGQVLGTVEIKMPVHNLPIPNTPFIDRPTEIERIRAQFDDSECRLLTLTGQGGVGKTRLALQVAAMMLSDFSHGVFYLALPHIESLSQIALAILETTRAKVTNEPQGDPKTQLLNHLSKKHILLILDGVENMSDHVDLLVDILTSAPDVKLLVTSRERLNLQLEWAIRIPSMAYPEPDAQNAERYEAVQLFLQGARRMQPGFSFAENKDSVLHICRLVQGLPLGIELATALLRVMSCGQIAAKIEQGLDILQTSMRNVPEKHQSIRANYEMSWNLLNADEQAALQRLSIFDAEFDAQTAQKIAGVSEISILTLYDKSLLESTNDHYELPRLLRQFTREKISDHPTERLKV